MPKDDPIELLCYIIDPEANKFRLGEHVPVAVGLLAYACRHFAVGRTKYPCVARTLGHEKFKAEFHRYDWTQPDATFVAECLPSLRLPRPRLHGLFVDVPTLDIVRALIRLLAPGTPWLTLPSAQSALDTFCIRLSSPFMSAPRGALDDPSYQVLRELLQNGTLSAITGASGSAVLNLLATIAAFLSKRDAFGAMQSKQRREKRSQQYNEIFSLFASSASSDRLRVWRLDDELPKAIHRSLVARSNAHVLSKAFAAVRSLRRVYLTKHTSNYWQEIAARLREECQRSAEHKVQAEYKSILDDFYKAMNFTAPTGREEPNSPT
ncbi:hypothetical protein EXIGLDRAFT_766331 [Exidia glandulosa HHB12029]|uniref:Uncharacterized protein n=1 Tax=Exidia glandulosa HHB12029 TaxID=1314781 RepID=A0A165JTS8_EXIGL|nr:hypothetical protein EXIGLDRAFT_766331 [Exidia glandulosa HHB12029]